ncbi:MAG: hypothetical protein JW963_17645 [Anaerolineales bacterium]|nr:hypothetical protein [Anaerolineales bacterium]
MHKSVLIVIAMLFLQACQALDFLPLANTPIPSSTVTNTPTVTFTPTRTATPTPRDTVTPIGTFPTFTPVVLVSPDLNALVPDFIATPDLPTGGFESVTLSQSKIFYGSCKQNFIQMIITVENPVEVKTVYLFFRLESGKRPGDTTPWSGTVTDKDGGGVFHYTLWARNIPERKNFIKAWVHYQLVAVDEDENILGRSQIFTRNLILEPCK